MQLGKLIVIEGADGAGKTTQLDLLLKHYTSQNIKTQTLDFPQYTKTFFGRWIGRFLNGEFGKLHEIPPYLLTFPYAADRWQAKDEIKNWLDSGKFVFTNRYTPSNAVYQAAKLPTEKREEFIKWCFEMEYDVFQIPKEDLVIYLHVPVEVSQKLLEQKGERSYLDNGKKDLHEANTQLLSNVESLYLGFCERFSHWTKIDCCMGGQILSKEEIHSRIKEALKTKIVDLS